MITLTEEQVEAVYRFRAAQEQNGDDMRDLRERYPVDYGSPGWQAQSDAERQASEELDAVMTARMEPVKAALAAAGIEIWHDPDEFTRHLDKAEAKGYMTAEAIAGFRAQIEAEAPLRAAQRARMEAQAKL
jgi:hypothetical protein